MSVPNPPTITPCPSPAPSTSDTINFDSRADSYHAWLPTFVNVQLAAVIEWIRDRANEMLANSTAATAAATAATAAANSAAVQNAAANAATAQAAATAAGVYAAQAQATNPNSPIRINPTRITANFTLTTGYNGASAGPIAIDPGATVTLQPGSTWSIH